MHLGSAILLAFAAALFSGLLALSVAWYKRRSPAHWAFAAGMLVLAAESVFFGLSLRVVLAEHVIHWQRWRLLAVAFLPGPWIFFSLSYARGNYLDSLHRARFLLAAAFLVPVALATFFFSDLISLRETIDGNLSIGLGWTGHLVSILFLCSAVLVLLNIERTFRAAVGTMRWRIKFMVIGLGVLFAARAYVSSQILVYRAINPSLQMVNSAALLVACLLILRSLVRPGHFDVQVYPSQALIHNSLTLLLAGLYLAMVGILAKAVTFLGGDVSVPLKASVVLLSLVLLTVLLLSDRVRLNTQRFVSRHFQRPIYDYRTVWKTFTEGTTHCVEQADLCQAVVKLNSSIFQALSVTLWLLDERKQGVAFGASTFLYESKAARLRLEPADALQAIQALREHAEPIDLDASKQLWASILRRLHPEEFHKGGNRVCAPMFAGAELLGFIILGDRVGGLQFSQQDLDLLKSVSDQSGASLMNVRLSQRLAQARQLEAFQTMSAFFVHDLKNTASTLSLMLQNLPTHFNNPEFREDALRGIRKTVAHINDMISRLSLLREELVVKPVETDLNALVESTLKCLGTPPDVEVVRDFGVIPKVPLDPPQIQNVLTNLLLNARDALGPGGRISIKTIQRDGWIIVYVNDNGCGMTPEFLNNSLFRPFQTTKKKGIGIGIYQSKMIVEAHHGRIEVESQPGQGTTFTLLLPCSRNG